MASSPGRDRVDEILRAAGERSFADAPLVEAIELGRTDPQAVADLAVEVVRRFPTGANYLNAALSYLPDPLWDGVVRVALDAIEQGKGNESAESIIGYAGLQGLTSLHPHLDRIFRIRPNAGTYLEYWPWRESSPRDFDGQLRILEDREAPRDLRLDAWVAMLETRHPRALSRALALADTLDPSVDRLALDEAIDARLSEVGFARVEGRLERLAPQAIYHLLFPEPFFERLSRPPWLRPVHPTWRLPATVAIRAARFGGLAEGDCHLCAGRLHRLIAFEATPDGLGVSAMGRLELATCLSCLEWERSPLYYRHESDGRAVGTGYDGPPVVPRFPAEPLRESAVHLAATPPRWRWQNWGMSNGRENLNRLGGEPCWVQSAKYPACPSCDRLMSSLLQLDSDLPTESGGEWQWGTGGVGYGFWCDRCKVSAYLWQCT
jgi:hypothetical protein